MKTGALYIRVSTDDQTEYSPDSQIKLCTKYALENNIEVLEEHIYQEDGISGTKADKRPQFQLLITNAKKKPKSFDVILVYDFSRFARNKDESVMYKTLLRKKLDIDVISITQPLGEGKERIILESLYEAMDEYYSANLSENVKRGKLEKASRGEWQGKAPIGYDVDKENRTLKINEEESKIVQMIFDEFIKVKKIKNIVIKLNDLQIFTKTGNNWCDRSLKIVLRNCTYIGKIRFTEGGTKRDWHNPETNFFNGKHPVIVNQETFDEVQKILDYNEEINYKWKKSAPIHVHWLRGILKCSNCGGTMVKNKVTNRTNSHFQCANYVKSKCKISHFVTVHEIENVILKHLKEAYTKKIEINMRKEYGVENMNEVTLLKSKLKGLEQKGKRIKDAYQNGIDSLEEYKENKSSLNEQKQQLKKQLEKYENGKDLKEKKEEIYKRCEQLHNLMNDTETDEELKYEISHLLFNKIVFDKLTKKITIYYK